MTDDIRFIGTATYNERKSEQLLAAMPIVLGTGPGAGAQSRTVFISADSLYNPFGATVSRIQRRAVETGGRSFNQNVDTFAFNGGFEGALRPAMDRYFALGCRHGVRPQRARTTPPTACSTCWHCATPSARR